jgi:hypothetical protein
MNLPNSCQKEGKMRLYYLRQRNPGDNFQFILMDQVARKQIATRSTGTSDEKKAEAIAHEWLLNGLPESPRSARIARTTTFCDYLYQFWNFDASEYFKELATMGKEPHREHAEEMPGRAHINYDGTASGGVSEAKEE